ncbi:hypothetical protein HK105_200209 [Polyrhizophydium stewartii]|uniref:Uncharacterized protein n=1 Tax=Polyrhizophydium stewartii TaxID=2732419 RepID=A0ABR4NKT4_9FUNG
MLVHAAALALAAASQAAAFDTVQLWFQRYAVGNQTSVLPPVTETVAVATRQGEAIVCASRPDGSSYAQFTPSGDGVVRFTCTAANCAGGCTGEPFSSDGKTVRGQFNVLASGRRLLANEIMSLKPLSTGVGAYFTNIVYGRQDCSGDPTQIDGGKIRAYVYNDTACAGSGKLFFEAAAVPADAAGGSSSCNLGQTSTQTATNRQSNSAVKAGSAAVLAAAGAVGLVGLQLPGSDASCDLSVTGIRLDQRRCAAACISDSQSAGFSTIAIIIIVIAVIAFVAAVSSAAMYVRRKFACPHEDTTRHMPRERGPGHVEEDPLPEYEGPSHAIELHVMDVEAPAGAVIAVESAPP